MEIFVKKTSDTLQDRRGEQGKKPKKFKFDRRRSRQDRRQSVLEGVVVSLSSREEKRKQQDRRQVLSQYHQVQLVQEQSGQPEVMSAPLAPPEVSSVDIVT